MSWNEQNERIEAEASSAMSYCRDLMDNPPTPPTPKRKTPKWRRLLTRMFDELVFCVIVGAAGYGFYRLSVWGNSLPVSTGRAAFVPTVFEKVILVGMPCSAMVILTCVCLGSIVRRKPKALDGPFPGRCAGCFEPYRGDSACGGGEGCEYE